MTALDTIKKILTFIIDIIEFPSTIHNLIPTLRSLNENMKSIQELASTLQSLNENMKQIHELAPTLCSLNDDVLKPYLEACKGSKVIMEQVMKNLEDHGDQRLKKDVTSLNIKEMVTLAQAFQLPVLGGMYRGQLNAMRAMQYYHHEKNAPPTANSLTSTASHGKATLLDLYIVTAGGQADNHDGERITLFEDEV